MLRMQIGDFQGKHDCLSRTRKTSDSLYSINRLDNSRALIVIKGGDRVFQLAQSRSTGMFFSNFASSSSFSYCRKRLNCSAQRRKSRRLFPLDVGDKVDQTIVVSENRVF